MCVRDMDVTTDRKGYAPMFGVNLHGTGCQTVRLPLYAPGRDVSCLFLIPDGYKKTMNKNRKQARDTPPRSCILGCFFFIMVVTRSSITKQRASRADSNLERTVRHSMMLDSTRLTSC